MSTGQKPANKAELLAKKQSDRAAIDKLDSEIVRLLDRRLVLAVESGDLCLSTDGFSYKEMYIDSVRGMICELKANSEIKQAIWEVFSMLFDIRPGFVATPFSYRA